MRERLIELLNYIPCKAESCAAVDGGRCGDLDNLSRCQIEAIADYLLENGVVISPCKIGQSFWRINWKYQIEPCRVSMLTQKSDCNFKIRISPLNGAAFEIVPSDIGKTVFLSRKEAERALKGGD